MGVAEHLRAVGQIMIDRDIGQGTRPKMSAIRHAEQLCRSDAGHGGDLGKRIFARHAGQMRHIHRRFGQIRHPLRPEIAAHQQCEKRGIGGERRAIGMVGGEKHLAGVCYPQKQFEPAGPLHGIMEVLAGIGERHHAAAIAVAVKNHRLFRFCRAHAVILPHHIRRDGDGGLEHHLADIDGDIGVGIDRLRQLRGGRGKALGTLFAIGVKLQVRQMHRQAARRCNGRQRSLDIAGNAKVVGMDVEGMRHADIDGRLLKRLDNGARGDAIMRHHIVQIKAAQIILERRCRSGIDDLDAKAARRGQNCRDIIADGGAAFAIADHAQQKIIIAEHR